MPVNCQRRILPSPPDSHNKKTASVKDSQNGTCDSPGRKDDRSLGSQHEENMTQNSNSVLVERDRKVSIVTINRPEVKNAVDSATARALAEAFEAFDRDDSLNVAILTGAQGAFCAGADLREVASGRPLDKESKYAPM